MRSLTPLFLHVLRHFAEWLVELNLFRTTMNNHEQPADLSFVLSVPAAASRQQCQIMPGVFLIKSRKSVVLLECSRPQIIPNFPILPSFRFRLDLPTRIYSDSAYTSTSYNPTLVHWSYTILKSSHDDLVYSVKAYKDWETNLREARDASKVRKDLTSQTILNRSAPSHGRCIPPSFKVTSCYILSTWLTLADMADMAWPSSYTVF